MATKDTNRTALTSRPTVPSPNAYPRMQPRSHTHSLSAGSVNPAHRVTRRKSMSSNGSSAAMVAAVNTAVGIVVEGSNGHSKRAGRPGRASHSAIPASLPTTSGFSPSGIDSRNSSAVVDGPPLTALPETDKDITKSRMRRASEGSRLTKGESKRAAAGELRCETCGKGYKHSSCLTKHLWEHTPEWSLTSKLLISKHQQVQLLEAASVLVAMNVDAVESDTSSPAASGSSDLHSDGMSSTDASPPPQADAAADTFDSSPKDASKRFSSNSSVYSHSYQSSIFSESAPNSRPYMSHYRQWSADNRPTTSGTSVTGSYTDEEHADLAAAVGLLSCSFGTPKTNPVLLPADVPPVPPLPAQFLGQKADHLSGSTITGIRGYDSYVRERRDEDVDMMEEDDDDFHHGSVRGGGRSDEEEEGMFGKMEE